MNIATVNTTQPVLQLYCRDNKICSALLTPRTKAFLYRRFTLENYQISINIDVSSTAFLCPSLTAVGFVLCILAFVVPLVARGCPYMYMKLFVC